jgi:hypothetical protein
MHASRPYRKNKNHKFPPLAAPYEVDLGIHEVVPRKSRTYTS